MGGFYLLLKPTEKLGQWNVEECLGPDAGLAVVYRLELVSCSDGPFKSLNH